MTAIPLVLLGVFGPACGLYVRWVAPERRELETVAEFAPSHVPAYVLAAVSLVLLAAVLYLLLGTELPYVYPGVVFLLFFLGLEFSVDRAAHTVNLVKLPGQHFFHTLRSKLMWGVRRSGQSTKRGRPDYDDYPR